MMDDEDLGPVRWIVPPVFVVSDDVTSFDSLDELLVCVEPWDVDDETVVYDALGRRVNLRAEGVVRTRRTVGGGRLVVDPGASGVDGSAELASALRRYVGRLGAERTGLASSALDAKGFSDLVELAHRWSRRS